MPFIRSTGTDNGNGFDVKNGPSILSWENEIGGDRTTSETKHVRLSWALKKKEEERRECKKKTPVADFPEKVESRQPVLTRRKIHKAKRKRQEIKGESGECKSLAKRLIAMQET